VPMMTTKMMVGLVLLCIPPPTLTHWVQATSPLAMLMTVSESRGAYGI
jgi:hypothetical protein